MHVPKNNFPRLVLLLFPIFLRWSPIFLDSHDFFLTAGPQPADRNNHISDGVTAPIEKYVIFAARKYIHIPDAGRNSSQPAPYIADTLQTLLCL